MKRTLLALFVALALVVVAPVAQEPGEVGGPAAAEAVTSYHNYGYFGSWCHVQWSNAHPGSETCMIRQFRSNGRLFREYRDVWVWAPWSGTSKRCTSGWRCWPI